jgi:hypothetical protein
VSGPRVGLARIAEWLVEPVGEAAPSEAAPPPAASEPAPPPAPPTPTVLTFPSPAGKSQDGASKTGVELPIRPVVAVVALAPASGATTLALALAATLASRDHSGTAILVGAEKPAGSGLSTRAAGRLTARIASGGPPARAAGRLCLACPTDLAALAGSLRSLAPLVLDLPRGRQEAVSIADIAILIAPSDAEPALAELAARSLARTARDSLTVVAGTSDHSQWQGRAFVHLPHSRLGAWMAAAGWEPRGPFGAAVAKLADACEEAAVV